MSNKQNHRTSGDDNGQARRPKVEQIDGDSFTDTIPEMARLKKYEIIKKLGQGTFGVVQKARDRPTGEIVAIKQLLNHSAKEGFPITAMREITILKQLHHHNILNIKELIFEEAEVTNPADVVTQRGSFYTVSPYMTSDLVGILENPDVKLQLNQIKCIMTQLLEGTQYIHEQNFLHRDIKAANILIDNTGVLKIADFGLARLYHGEIPRLGMGPGGGEKAYTALVVTRWYRPPELLLGERKYTTAVDLWGIGCVFAELFTRKPILVGKSDAHQAQLIFELIGPPNTWTEAAKLPNKTDFNIGLTCKRSLEKRFDSLMPPSGVKLLSGLLTLDPYKRFNALDALNQDFFKSEPLPLRPEEMPQFGECHEIDKEKFKKLRETNNLPSRPESRNLLEGKRFDRDEDKFATRGTPNRDDYDDYEKTYVRRSTSRQALHHHNYISYGEDQPRQRTNQARSYYDDRGQRTQDERGQNGYADNEFENDRAPHKNIDYGGPKNFEANQVYPYIPRSELNDSSYSRRDSPHPLSRADNRANNKAQCQKNNDQLNYLERRPPSKAHKTSEKHLPSGGYNEERVSQATGDRQYISNTSYDNKDARKNDPSISIARSSPGSSLDEASSVIDIDYKNNGDDKMGENRKPSAPSGHTQPGFVKGENSGGSNEAAKDSDDKNVESTAKVPTFTAPGEASESREDARGKDISERIDKSRSDIGDDSITENIRSGVSERIVSTAAVNDFTTRDHQSLPSSESSTGPAVNKTRKKSVPYVHGGLSERILNSRSSSPSVLPPNSKQMKTPSVDKPEESKVEKVESIPKAQSQDIELKRSSLPPTADKERHGGIPSLRRVSVTKQSEMKDLFGKAKINSLPISLTRSQLPKPQIKSSKDSRETSSKGLMTDYAIKTTKGTKRNHSYIDDDVSESDLSEVDVIPEEGGSRKLLENFLNKEGYKREPIYRKHMSESRKFRR
ncbi:BUR1 [Candida margitis]|uniref:BUR1 n=1 Tax=Candida margitis TaxID=1775924 RepID=UPI00222784D4|nr:BUR1 [Candida margitis]KAI5968882.1 BUR1 [Candida margitis]